MDTAADGPLLPFHEYVAKNVGIRPASGSFFLVNNSKNQLPNGPPAQREADRAARPDRRASERRAVVGERATWRTRQIERTTGRGGGGGGRGGGGGKGGQAGRRGN